MSFVLQVSSRSQAFAPHLVKPALRSVPVLVFGDRSDAESQAAFQNSLAGLHTFGDFRDKIYEVLEVDQVPLAAQSTCNQLH